MTSSVGRGRGVRLLLAPVAAALILGALAGCGKKGPPRLPDLPELPVVQDLAHRIDRGAVELTWSIPATSVPGITGFYVYRSMEPLAEEPCEGCPTVYEKTAIIHPDAPSGDTVRFVFSEPVAAGYRYAYRVVAYGEGVTEGKASNAVRFEVPKSP